jgi:hypothetical protein
MKPLEEACVDVAGLRATIVIPMVVTWILVAAASLGTSLYLSSS